MKGRRPSVVLLAPVPASPDVCRWCTGRIRDGQCVTGCRAEPRLPERCAGCNREHRTGQRNPVLCWQCDRTERAQYAADFAQPTLGRGHRDLSVDFHRKDGAA